METCRQTLCTFFSNTKSVHIYPTAKEMYFTATPDTHPHRDGRLRLSEKDRMIYKNFNLPLHHPRAATALLRTAVRLKAHLYRFRFLTCFFHFFFFHLKWANVHKHNHAWVINRDLFSLHLCCSCALSANKKTIRHTATPGIPLPSRSADAPINDPPAAIFCCSCGFGSWEQ